MVSERFSVPDQLLRKFSEFGTLTAVEAAALPDMLGALPRSVGENVTIRREGETPRSFFFLLDGWAITSTLLSNGARHILQLHLPGEVFGTASLCAPHAAATVTTLTPVSLVEVPLEQFGALLEEFPRVAANFLLGLQRDGIALMDWLALIARSSAAERVASVLLDIEERLDRGGEVEDGCFELRITQEHLGDLVGLTAVHVNRVMRTLEASASIRRVGKRRIMIDKASLSQLDKRPRRNVSGRLHWLNSRTTAASASRDFAALAVVSM
ncbi:MAG: Crp/Fnr family transcriptional regulator [Sphingomonas sp.]